VPDGPLSSSLTRCIQTLQLFGAAGDLLLIYEVLL